MITLPEQQRALVELLRRPSALRALSETGALTPALQGLDRDALLLAGKLSLMKRRTRVESALPRTFASLPNAADTFQAFADEVPLTRAGRLADAAAFHGFLGARIGGAADRHQRIVVDVAAVELALLQSMHSTAGDRVDGGQSIRLSPLARLVTCAHDVRVLFEQGLKAIDRVAPGPVELVVLWRDPDGRRVLQVSAEIGAALRDLNSWTSLGEQPGWHEAAPGSPIAQLLAAGVLERSR